MRNYLINLSIYCNGDYRKMEMMLSKLMSVPKYKVCTNAITIMDKDYPIRLLDLESPPLVLYYRGDTSLLNLPSAGVIGSRKPSAYAVRMTEKLVRKISKGLVIVSGLAYGIDSVAHKAALNEKTIAVLGCGIDVYYPKAHQSLQDKIHCIISEYPNGREPRKHHFQMRNRIISALSDSLYIMAAEIRSGTITTVDEAVKINRDIICLPHNIDERAGAGCNHLIGDGASVLTNI